MAKILIVIKDIHNYSGTEKVCHYMTKFLKYNNIVDIVSLEGEGEPFYDFIKNKIIRLERKKFKLLALVSVINKDRYDFVFVVSMGKLSLLFRAVALLVFKGKTKFFACEHVAIQSFSPLKRALKLFALKWYYSVIVLTKNDGLLLEKNNINSSVIPNPIFFHDYKKVNRTYKVLAVGRLENQKGFSDLISIWSDFIKNNRGYTLQIAGEGSLEKKLLDQVTSLQLNDSVIFLGKVKDMDSLYRHSDFLVMTSVYEGLPLTLLEAKSWSLPVIAFNCPTGPKEIINDGIDGYLINNRSFSDFVLKMNTLSKDEVLYRMSLACLDTHKEFDETSIKSKWEALIR